MEKSCGPGVTSHRGTANGRGFIPESPTWRASAGWGAKLG